MKNKNTVIHDQALKEVEVVQAHVDPRGIDTRYRVSCVEHGNVCLTRDEYMAQLGATNDRWRCPLCQKVAGFDDDWYERPDPEKCRQALVDLLDMSDNEKVAVAIRTLGDEGATFAIDVLDAMRTDPVHRWANREAMVVISYDPDEGEPTPVPLADLAADALSDLRYLL